jgi:hypothetical protein
LLFHGVRIAQADDEEVAQAVRLGCHGVLSFDR